MIDDVVDALAVARITRLVVDDRVPFGWLRGKLVDWSDRRASRADREPYVSELLSCAWCASIWVAVFVLVARRFRIWRPLARVLAASEVAGIAATYVER